MGTKVTEDIKVGQAVQRNVNVGKYQPIYYAGASGDFNLIHIDKEFGQMVGLGGAILQGLCTMSFVAAMCTEWGKGDPGALKKIKVRFAKPVRPEDAITVNGNVASIDDASAHLEIEAVNQEKEEVITLAWADVELRS